MRVTSVVSSVVVLAGAVVSGAPADYSENGANWGEKCTGPDLYRQSPIELPTEIYSLLSSTKPAEVDLPVTTLQPVTIFTNPKEGKIKVSITDATVDVTGAVFEGLEELQIPGADTVKLLSMHFHAKAEHVYVAGKKQVRDGLEAHFVFTDAAGTPRAVLGAMFKESSIPNPYLSLLFPKGHGKEYEVDAPQEGVIALLFPEEMKTPKSYWASYPGSLTTPDCDETIQWFVTQVDATAEQIAEFKPMIDGADNGGEGTYRVPQPLYGRKIELVQIVTPDGARPFIAAAAAATVLTVAAVAF